MPKFGWTTVDDRLLFRTMPHKKRLIGGLIEYSKYGMLSPAFMAVRPYLCEASTSQITELNLQQ